MMSMVDRCCSRQKVCGVGLEFGYMDGIVFVRFVVDTFGGWVESGIERFDFPSSCQRDPLVLVDAVLSHIPVDR